MIPIDGPVGHHRPHFSPSLRPLAREVPGGPPPRVDEVAAPGREQSLDGIASRLGMSVVELLAALDGGMSLRDVFAERGVAPAPGSIADMRM